MTDQREQIKELIAKCLIDVLKQPEPPSGMIQAAIRFIEMGVTPDDDKPPSPEAIQALRDSLPFSVKKITPPPKETKQ